MSNLERNVTGAQAQPVSRTWADEVEDQRLAIYQAQQRARELASKPPCTECLELKARIIALEWELAEIRRREGEDTDGGV